MDVSNQKSNQNYTLNSGSGSRKDVLNYQQEDYNNYHSWSNVGRGNISLSIVGEDGVVNSNNFPYHRLQPLAAPFISFANTSLSWAPANGKHTQPENNFMAKN